MSRDSEKSSDSENLDTRLYVPDSEGWEAEIKRDWENEYCFSANPGEDFFHSLLNGEIYLRRGDEKYCLNCAMRMEILTTDRGFWQKSVSSTEGSIHSAVDKNDVYDLEENA
jgi:hypothetical protein